VSAAAPAAGREKKNKTHANPPKKTQPRSNKTRTSESHLLSNRSLSNHAATCLRPDLSLQVVFTHV
jgi:hypothetical protein